ncbi:hypothetical protein DYB36_012236 [Aphanomyces astaci]|uniref:START domain-containing protein n=1 Tax=Aphanomyces astaci TaxID=112090 RepID=A0A397BS35_APHAT|nr:hypothetical protein DYB36_012236 [Aphanomyces astaci]
MSLKLPLPPGFFQCPPLSPDDNARYLEIAKQSVQDLVAKARIRDGPVKWTMLSNECDLKIYKGEGTGTTANSDIHCAAMETVGQLDEVMRLYRTDTTAQAKEYVQRFGRALVDAITLYTILPRHPDRPNNCIQIKWMVAKSPFDGLVTKRDFCLLESDLEFQVNGKRAWVRAYKSVELACVPSLRESLNLIRAFQYDMGHVFIESDRPGYLDMTYLADMDVKGIVPVWANDQAVIQWCRNLSDIDRFLREDRLRGSVQSAAAASAKAATGSSVKHQVSGSSPTWGADSTFDGTSQCSSDDQSNYSESMVGTSVVGGHNTKLYSQVHRQHYYPREGTSTTASSAASTVPIMASYQPHHPTSTNTEYTGELSPVSPLLRAPIILE